MKPLPVIVALIAIPWLVQGSTTSIRKSAILGNNDPSISPIDEHLDLDSKRKIAIDVHNNGSGSKETDREPYLVRLLRKVLRKEIDREETDRRTDPNLSLVGTNINRKLSETPSVTKRQIFKYEVIAAGDGSMKKPYGQVFSVDPFNAKTYFEYNPGAPPRTVELFTGANSGDCSSGTLLSDSLYTAAFLPGPTNYNASTSNGIIGTAEFTIANVESTPAYTALAGDTARVQLCSRISVKQDIDPAQAGAEYVSFVDTYLNVDVAISSTVAFFQDTVVDIERVAADQLNESMTTTVDMEAFLCASGANASSTYRMGQNFTVCVRPSARFVAKGYSVDGFTSATCNNSAWSQRFVENSKPSGFLTTLIQDPSSYLSASGEEAGPAAKAFQSIVFSGFFKGSDTSMTCTGQVSLNRNNTNVTRRLMWTATSGDWDASLSGRDESDPSALPLRRRELQETESGNDDDDANAPFFAAVGLSSEVATEALESSEAFVIERGWSRLFLATGGAAAMISAL